MQRKLILAGLTALSCLATASMPALSQERTNPQTVEPHIEEALNRNRPADMPIMENPSRETWTQYFQQGEAERMQGNFSAALRDYDRALALNPNAYDVFLSKAATYDKMGMFQRVIENYDIAISMHPRMEKVWMARTAFFARRGNAAQALRDLDEGIRYLPDSTNLRIARGVYYLNRKSYGQALSDFNAALIVKPQLMQALDLKAVCENHLQNYPAFESTLSQIISLDSKRVAAWVQRARVRMRFNRLAEADSDFTHALYADPHDLDARIGRGMLRLRLAQADMMSEAGQQMCQKSVDDLKLACKGGDKASCQLARKPACTLPPKPAAKKPAPAPASNATSTTPPSSATDKANGFPEAPASTTPSAAPSAAPSTAPSAAPNTQPNSQPPTTKDIKP